LPITTIQEPTGNALGKQTALGQGISFFNQNPKVSKQARLADWNSSDFPRLGRGAEYVVNHGYDIEITRNINALPSKIPQHGHLEVRNTERPNDP